MPIPLVPQGVWRMFCRPISLTRGGELSGLTLLVPVLVAVLAVVMHIFFGVFLCSIFKLILCSSVWI